MDEPPEGQPLLSREVYLFGSIDGENLKRAWEGILGFFEADPQKPVKLMLHSAGGEAGLAVAFYELVRLKGIPLEIDVFNECSSAALLVLAAGRRRRASPSTIFLFHEVSRSFGEGARCTVRELDIYRRDLECLRGVGCRIIAEAAGKPVEEIEKMVERTQLVMAEEALKFGLIHEIINVPR